VFATREATLTDFPFVTPMGSRNGFSVKSPIKSSTWAGDALCAVNCKCFW